MRLAYNGRHDSVAYFRSPATGRTYRVGADRRAVPVTEDEFLDATFEDEYEFIPDEDGSEAFGRYLEDRAARGTWFGGGE